MQFLASRERLVSKRKRRKPARPKRSLGTIIASGPKTSVERSQLHEYRRRFVLFLKRKFPDAGFAQTRLVQLIRRSLVRLTMSDEQFRLAIMAWGTPESDRVLQRIAANVRQQLKKKRGDEFGNSRRIDARALKLLKQSEIVAESLRFAPPKSRGRRKIGDGSHPNDCCQMCGRFLQIVCYSLQLTKVRVPRTNKICKQCHASLPANVRGDYYKYVYKHGHEPKGVGWNPKKIR
jgi:hypothetical protein